MCDRNEFSTHKLKYITSNKRVINSIKVRSFFNYYEPLSYNKYTMGGSQLNTFNNKIIKRSFSHSLLNNLYLSIDKNILKNIINTTNILKDKEDILKLLKNKSGIYMWRHKNKGDKYIGSSVNLKRRLSEYLNVNRIQKILVCI